MKALQQLRKLRAMSAAEIGARLAAASYRAYERRTVSARPRRVRLRAGADELRTAGAAGPAFLDSVRDLPQTRAALAAAYSREVAAAGQRADRVMAGDITLFGRTHSFGSHVDWHLDPVSRRPWPLTYHADAPVGDPGRAPGDVKDVWELNRHQFLLDLAGASLVTGRPEYAARIHALVRSWVEANPYGIGINWAGPLEVAYRSLSWLWAYHLTRDALAPDDRLLWLEGFRDHGRFLYRHLELFSSPYNHLIGEAAMLYVLGVRFPRLPGAHRWRRRGRAVLLEHLPRQFHDEGGGVEQAVVYHHATLGFGLLAALVARNNGDAFPSAVWTSLERAVEFSMFLTQPDGRQPAIGDTDDARPLAFDAADPWDFRNVQAAGAVLFDRPDFKWSAGRFHEDAFWLLGPAGMARFDAMPAAAPVTGSRALCESGYVVLRSGWDRRADYVCFDCGEQAGGLRHDDVPSAAHGHADALSVVVHLGGEPVLVDAGFYTYDGERAWERAFRETAAHNTVRIDGRDQAQHLEKMAWIHVPRVALEAYGTNDRLWATASHDGYAHGPLGIRHRRTVWLRRRGYVVLYDELEGAGEHVADVTFQFPAGVRTAVHDDCVVLQDRFVATWCATSAMDALVTAGGSTPEEGWVAPSLGVRVPAAKLVLRAPFVGSLRLLTVVADTAVWTRGVTRIQHSSDEGLALRLAAEAATDLVIGSTGQHCRAAGYRTDGSIGAWRLEQGRVVDAAQLGGTFVSPTRSHGYAPAITR